MAETGCHRVTCNKPDTGKPFACDLPHVRAMKVDLVKAESRRVVTKDWAGQGDGRAASSQPADTVTERSEKGILLVYYMLLICN